MRIHLAAEHPLELEPPHARLERTGVALDLPCRRLVVFAFRQLEQFGGVTDSQIGAIEFLDLGREPRALATQLLGAIRRAPDRRVFQFTAYFFETFFLAVVLKETPSRRRPVPRDL
jgi:hypothetical protein